MKFGGTSMGSAERIASVAHIVRSSISREEMPIVVVSAMSGVTNLLLDAAYSAVQGEPSEKREKILKKLKFQHMETAELLVQDAYQRRQIDTFLRLEFDHLREFLSAIAIIRELSPLSHDEVVSLGEKLSAALLAAHLNDSGTQAEYVDLSHLVSKPFSQIDSDFFDHVEEDIKRRVRPIVDKKCIPVLTGFFGRIPGGIVEGVGRGYSDFTAALSGAAFNVQEIQIWTDVDGLLSADPRLVKYTCVLPEVSYDEAGELAQFGAKVLHPQTVWPAVKRSIPVRIKNTMNPEAPGTLITRDGTRGQFLCKSVASKKGVTVITLTSSRMLMAVGYLADVFAIFKKHGVSVDVVATGEISVTMTVDLPLESISEKALEELKTFSRIDILEKQAIICAVGSELTHQKGAAARMLDAIADADISVRAISQSAQEINISVIMNESDADVALLALHKAIFEGDHQER